MEQYEHATAHGFKFEPWTQPGQPYKDSKEMSADVAANKHLWYFPTDSGFGSDDRFKDHPLYEDVPGAHGVKYNDLFRAVHDLYAHAMHGHQFGPTGELRAWTEHARMFSPLARKALTTETHGQNSWVNFGPHEPWKLPVTERPYADQKASILPTDVYPKVKLAKAKPHPEEQAFLNPIWQQFRNWKSVVDNNARRGKPNVYEGVPPIMDDTSRGVFADWLAERGDPREPIVRGHVDRKPYTMNDGHSGLERHRNFGRHPESMHKGNLFWYDALAHDDYSPVDMREHTDPTARWNFEKDLIHPGLAHESTGAPGQRRALPTVVWRHGGTVSSRMSSGTGRFVDHPVMFHAPVSFEQYFKLADSMPAKKKAEWEALAAHHGWTRPGAEKPVKLAQKGFSYSAFGYWVDPHGNSHDVGNDTHDKWMQTNHGRDEKAAMADGWHKINAFTKQGSDAVGHGAPNAAQRETFGMLAIRHSAYPLNHTVLGQPAKNIKLGRNVVHDRVAEDARMYRKHIRPLLVHKSVPDEHALMHDFFVKRGLKVAQSAHSYYDDTYHTMYHPNPEDKGAVARDYLTSALGPVHLARRFGDTSAMGAAAVKDMDALGPNAQHADALNVWADALDDQNDPRADIVRERTFPKVAKKAPLSSRIAAALDGLVHGRHDAPSGPDYGPTIRRAALLQSNDPSTNLTGAYHAHAFHADGGVTHASRFDTPEGKPAVYVVKTTLPGSVHQHALRLMYPDEYDKWTGSMDPEAAAPLKKFGRSPGAQYQPTRRLARSDRGDLIRAAHEAHTNHEYTPMLGLADQLQEEGKPGADLLRHSYVAKTQGGQSAYPQLAFDGVNREALSPDGHLYAAVHHNEQGPVLQVGHHVNGEEDEGSFHHYLPIRSHSHFLRATKDLPRPMRHALATHFRNTIREHGLNVPQFAPGDEQQHLKLARQVAQGGGAAVRQEQSANHDKRLELAKRVLSEAGLKGIVRSVLAHSKGGAKPSVSAVLGEAVNPKLAHYTAAWMGLLTQAKNMTVFHPGEGEDTLHVIDSPYPAAHVGEYLLKSGVPAFSTEHKGTGSRAFVINPMDLIDVEHAARGLGGTVQSIRGTAVRMQGREGFRQAIDDAEKEAGNGLAQG